jgi:subtilase family serine protease
MAPPTPAECRKDLGIACYSPRQVQRAYDLPPLYAKGFDGRGRTIVIVDQFGSPALRHDLAVFDRAFALPARRRCGCCSPPARCRRSTRRTPR